MIVNLIKMIKIFKNLLKIHNKKKLIKKTKQKYYQEKTLEVIIRNHL